MALIEVHELRGNSWHTFEAVIPIFDGIAVASIACREHDIHHLPRGNKMNDLTSLLRTFDQFTQKLGNGRSQHHFAIARIHTVTLQFNEQPLRPSSYGNCRLLPES